MRLPSVDWSILESELKALPQPSLREEDEPVDHDFAAILRGEVKGDLAERLEKAVEYVKRLDASLESCPTGHAFVNGKHFDLSDVGSVALGSCGSLTLSLGLLATFPAGSREANAASAGKGEHNAL